MKRKLPPTRVLLICLSLLLGCLAELQAQTKMISGTITSTDGTPLTGVSIAVQGTSTGTFTDDKGKYSLNVPGENATIVVSYIGYVTQTVAINNRPVIDVQLKSDINQLSGVVVTAFGIKREKRALGYAVQEVPGEDLTEARETNVASALAGRVAGVQVSRTAGGPGGSARVIIRGNNSLTGNNQPLYVVDGVPIDNTSATPGIDYGDGISNINPDDIASISVLKGGNAAALYGARAANGVILITTKTGRTRKGIGVSINSNLTLEKVSVVPTFQNTWGLGYDQNIFDAYTTIDGEKHPLLPGWLGDDWGPKMDGQLVAIETLPKLGLVPYVPQPNDNVKNFYDVGVTATNTVALSGGNEKTTFRLSVSDLHNTGIVPKSTFQRQTVDLRSTSNITSKLSVDAKVNYIMQKGHNRPSLSTSTDNPAYQLQRMPRFVDLDWLVPWKGPEGEYINWKSGGQPGNPYWSINEVVNDDKRDRVIGFFSAKYQFTNWLSLQARAGTDFYHDDRFLRKAVNTPSALTGMVMNTGIDVKETNVDALLSASGSLSKNFTGTLSLGANQMNRSFKELQYTGTDLKIPNLYVISNAADVRPDYSLQRRRMNSVYAFGNLGFKNYLFLDLTARNDWSSTLSKGNYSFFYPSVSASFVFTDAFKMNSQILPFGKLRVSYAQVGNDASPYLTKIGYSLGTVDYNGQGFAQISGRIPATDLKNELTESFEIGADLRFFNNRLGIDFTYYKSSTYDQILPINIPAATGFSSKVINSGQMDNRGIEVFVNATPVHTAGGFQWDATINFSKNKTTVVSLAPGIEAIVLAEVQEGQIEARPGESYGNIVGNAFERTPDGRLIVTAPDAQGNGGGKYVANRENNLLGNIQPDWLAGVSNIFSYKGFTVSALLDFKMGGKLFSNTKYYQNQRGTGKDTEKRTNLKSDGVIPVKNDAGEVTGYVPYDGPVNPIDYNNMAWAGILEYFVIDAGYINLREVTIGYTFSQSLLSKLPFTNVKLSLVGRNLCYFGNKDFRDLGIAPDASAVSTDAAEQGVERMAIPPTRSIGFNLSLTF